MPQPVSAEAMRICTAPYTPPMRPRAHDREAVCRVAAALAAQLRRRDGGIARAAR